jgi:hypothetical protein
MDVDDKKATALRAQFLLQELLNRDSLKRFHHPVTDKSFGPLYTSVVKPLPLSLLEIADKIKRLEYTSISTVVEDCDYLFTTVRRVVQNDDEIVRYAAEMVDFLCRKAPRGTIAKPYRQRTVPTSNTSEIIDGVYETLEYHERKLAFFGEQIAKLRELPDNIFADYTAAAAKSASKRAKHEEKKPPSLKKAKEILSVPVTEPEKKISDKQRRLVSHRTSQLSEKHVRHVIGILQKHNSRALKRPNPAVHGIASAANPPPHQESEDEYDVDFQVMEASVFDKVRNYVNRVTKTEAEKQGISTKKVQGKQSG